MKTPRGVAAAILGFLAAASAAASDHPDVAVNAPFLRVALDRPGGPETSDVTLQLPSALRPAALAQSIALPAPLPPLRLLRYLPLAALEQRLVSDPSGQSAPALRLAIEGPKLSYERCLAVGLEERDRLNSLIAAWRYVAAADRPERDELLARFGTELSRRPTLRIAEAAGGSFELPAEPGALRSLAGGGSVRVLEYYPHYERDALTGLPANRSGAPRNPAALVEVADAAGVHSRWVFTRFPEFDAGSPETAALRLSLDCPIETGTPDVLLVAVQRSRLEVWIRFDGKVSTRPLAAGEAVPIPGSQYVFRVTQFEASGRLIETYSATEDTRAGVTVLEYADSDAIAVDGASHWLVLGRSCTKDTPAGRLTLTFDRKRPAPEREHPHAQH